MALEREFDSHEYRLLNMPVEQARVYREKIENELEELTDRRLDVLQQKDRAIERYDKMLANIDVRQKELNIDIQILERGFSGCFPQKDWFEEDDARAAYYSGCLY